MILTGLSWREGKTFYEMMYVIFVERVAILAITRNGIEVGKKIRDMFEGWSLYVPEKFRNSDSGISWFSEPTAAKIGGLFRENEALICLFSLGAVIRLVTPHLGDKKSDPAVIVIDDGANFVISALSGHLGGANGLAAEIASRIGAAPVITTAADVNKTIPVDLVGREFGWIIDDDSTVTATSAHMVNKEKIGVFQGSGEMNWWKGDLPGNVTIFETVKDLESSDSRAFLIISDEIVDRDISSRAVVYRPKSLVVGIGLHGDTTKETIWRGIQETFDRNRLSTKSISALASVKKPRDVPGLVKLGEGMNIPVKYIDRERLAAVDAPNPSRVVDAFEGTASVAEAAAILVSDGRLVVQKQKFPPDLTVAVARRL